MKIETTFTKAGRVNVLADGEYRFTVPAVMWFSCPVGAAGEATEEELEALRLEAMRSDAYEKGLKLLSSRAHSEKELMIKLSQHYPRDICAYAVERLRAAGLADDRAFASVYAEEYSRVRHRSPQMIVSALVYEKGVDRETAEAAVSELGIDPDAEIAGILSKMADLNTQKGRQKAIRKLTGLGYAYFDIERNLPEGGLEWME